MEKGSRDQGSTRLRPTNQGRSPNKLAEEEEPEEAEEEAKMESSGETQKLVKEADVKIKTSKRVMSLLEATEEEAE